MPKFTVIELFIFPVKDFQFFKILWKRGQIWQAQLSEREFDRYIQGKKFVKLLEKSA